MQGYGGRGGGAESSFLGSGSARVPFFASRLGISEDVLAEALAWQPGGAAPQAPEQPSAEGHASRVEFARGGGQQAQGRDLGAGAQEWAGPGASRSADSRPWLANNPPLATERASAQEDGERAGSAARDAAMHGAHASLKDLASAQWAPQGQELRSPVSGDWSQGEEALRSGLISTNTIAAPAGNRDLEHLLSCLEPLQGLDAFPALPGDIKLGQGPLLAQAVVPGTPLPPGGVPVPETRQGSSGLPRGGIQQSSSAELLQAEQEPAGRGTGGQGQSQASANAPAFSAALSGRRQATDFSWNAGGLTTQAESQGGPGRAQLLGAASSGSREALQKAGSGARARASNQSLVGPAGVVRRRGAEGEPEAESAMEEGPEEGEASLMIPPEAQGLISTHWVLLGQDLQKKGVSLRLERFVADQSDASAHAGLSGGHNILWAQQSDSGARLGPSAELPGWRQNRSDGRTPGSQSSQGGTKPQSLEERLALAAAQQASAGKEGALMAGYSRGASLSNRLAALMDSIDAEQPRRKKVHVPAGLEVARLADGDCNKGEGGSVLNAPTAPRLRAQDSSAPGSLLELSDCIGSRGRSYRLRAWNASPGQAPECQAGTWRLLKEPQGYPLPSGAPMGLSAKAAFLKKIVMSAAASLDNGKMKQFETDCKNLKVHEARRGSPEERAVHVALQALLHRSRGTGFGLANKPSKTPIREVNQSRIWYYTALPFHPFVDIALTGMTIPVLLGKEDVHMVLLGEAVIPQLFTIIQLLSQPQAFLPGPSGDQQTPTSSHEGPLLGRGHEAPSGQQASQAQVWPRMESLGSATSANPSGPQPTQPLTGHTASLAPGSPSEQTGSAGYDAATSACGTHEPGAAAARPPGVLRRLRVTSIAAWHLVRPGRLDFETMKEAGRVSKLLGMVAAAAGIEFEFQSVRLDERASWEQNLRLLQGIKRRLGETMAFCGFADLKFLPDEPRQHGAQPELLMQFLNHLHPDVIAVGEEDLGANSDDLLASLDGAFDFLLGAFETHDLFSRPEQKRLVYNVEQQYFNLNFYSLIACQGPERRLHPRSSRQWAEAFEAAGFVPCSMTQKVIDAEHEMLRSYRDGFGLLQDGPSLSLLWKGRRTLFVSAWKPPERPL